MIGTKLRATLIITVAFTGLLQSIGAALDAEASSHPAAVVDLKPEARILDNFVNDLGKFDKKGSDLARKSSLTSAEFIAYERSATDLKGRLSSVQAALRQIVSKLKVAGQWEGLDETLLAKVSDAKFQQFVRGAGFKRLIDELANGLSNNASEIGSPLDPLRSKVTAQRHDSNSDPARAALSTRAIRVAYTAAAPAFKPRVRCGLARVRLGIAYLLMGPNDMAPILEIAAVGCYCDGVEADCRFIGAEVR